jgi:hypothetical protein
MRRYYSALRVAPYCSTDGLQYAESTRVETGRRPFRRVSLLHSTYVPQETPEYARFAALPPCLLSLERANSSVSTAERGHLLFCVYRVCLGLQRLQGSSTQHSRQGIQQYKYGVCSRWRAPTYLKPNSILFINSSKHTKMNCLWNQMVLPRSTTSLRSSIINNNRGLFSRYMSVIVLSDENAVKKFNAGNKKSILVRVTRKTGM